MHKILIFSVFVFIVFNVAFAQSEQARQVPIIDATKFHDATTNWKNREDVATSNEELARHRHHQVVVYKTNFRGATGYKVSYYQQENDSMRNHAFEVGDNMEPCDRASYTWSKDTLVIRLYNSASNKGKTYKGYGWGHSSSLVID